MERFLATTKQSIPIVIALSLILPMLVQAESDTEKLFYEDRDEIPIEFRWNIDDIFPSLEAVEGAFAQVEMMIGKMDRYKGQLTDSSNTLASALKAQFDLYHLYYEVLVYSNQFRDTNTRNPEANALYNRVSALGARVNRATAYIEPEISQIPTEELTQFLENKRVAAYGHYIENIVRLKPHIRSSEVEDVLASAELVARAPFEAYNNLTSADIEWPTIIGEDGEEQKVIPGLYYSFVNSQDRRVRREAALALFGTYTKFSNTFASTYHGHVQSDIFYARNRGYNRTIDMVMNENNVPAKVIENLVTTVHDGYFMLHRYAALRKRVLDIDEFHVYDLYVPLVPEADRRITYEEAKQICLDFWLETFGEEYAAVGEKSFNERWIDVYASEGKQGGAYSWGTYNSHPYMLLNWGGTLNDVLTLIHEMGHSIHTYMTNENQPFHYSDYSLFLAEVASVTAEALFMDYLIEKTDDPTEQLFLLNRYLNNITGTFLRQIFYHEFELRAHEMALQGEPSTKESLGEMYGQLWKDYYGPALVLDEEFKAGWARIPHFYRTYYVWFYATSFAAGESIAQRFRDGDETAVDDYLQMLKLGDSVYPMDALKQAGVDLNNPEVIKTVMVRYERTIADMENMLEE